MSISGWSQQEPDGDRSRSGLSGVASPPGYRKPCGQFCILSAFVFVRIAFSLTATTGFPDDPITFSISESINKCPLCLIAPGFHLQASCPRSWPSLPRPCSAPAWAARASRDDPHQKKTAQGKACAAFRWKGALCVILTSNRDH